MLKALFLDLDDTLCDTTNANEHAKHLLAEHINSLFEGKVAGHDFANRFVRGIYRTSWSPEEQERYLPLIQKESENAFRLQLIIDLLAHDDIHNISQSTAQSIQDRFNQDRLDAFDFYPGILDFLATARERFTLVVITNGPVLSQVPKVDAIKLKEHVDHIIIGGQEPEQKPHISIFNKALKLAKCEPHEAIHVGDSLKTDIAGALNSGITSLWVQHQQPLDAELGINPHHTVFHPSEIPDKIKQLHQK